MSFDINTNIASLQAQQYLRVNSDFQAKTINRVTSGLRISRVTEGASSAGADCGVSRMARLAHSVRDSSASAAHGMLSMPKRSSSSPQRLTAAMKPTESRNCSPR